MSDSIAVLDAQRPYLLRLALLLLRERDHAEGVVQRTLLAARGVQDKVAEKSSLRSWLTGILRHEIIDAIRKKAGDPAVSTLKEEADIEDLDAFFRKSDHDQWETKPAEWRNPERDLEQEQFIDMLEFCLERLPPNAARAFVLREVMGLEAAEICKELTITATHLWVILYRARMLLRACLEQNWFACDESKT